MPSTSVLGPTPATTTVKNSAEDTCTPTPAPASKQKTQSLPPQQKSSSPVQDSSTQSPVKQQPTLKYKYRENQWSPLNSEGKKFYDRSFLLNLRYADASTSKPEGIAHLPDIVLDAVSYLSFHHFKGNSRLLTESRRVELLSLTCQISSFKVSCFLLVNILGPFLTFQKHLLFALFINKVMWLLAKMPL